MRGKTFHPLHAHPNIQAAQGGQGHRGWAAASWEAEAGAHSAHSPRLRSGPLGHQNLANCTPSDRGFSHHYLRPEQLLEGKVRGSLSGAAQQCWGRGLAEPQADTSSSSCLLLSAAA